jgi:hypothetical protein
LVALIALYLLNLIRCSPSGRERFLLDLKFPMRLRNSGYVATIDFIQFFFEKYAQSGLTKKSDRDVAISGLVKRMESALGTKCRYGIFDAFFSRLLPWRRWDETDGNDTGYKDQHLPSWSWMTYSHIRFLPMIYQLKLPAKGDLRFDAERERVLLVQVRAFQNCTMGRNGSGYTILDADSRDIGVLWFDMTTNVSFHHCVVIGMDADWAFAKGAERTYHILLVKKLCLENQYERVGLGRIKSSCVSKEYCEGELF